MQIKLYIAMVSCVTVQLNFLSNKALQLTSNTPLRSVLQSTELKR